MARVTRQGQKVSLGVFKTAVDAAVAYAKHMREPPSVPAAPPTSGQAPAPPAGAAPLGSSPSAARAVAVAVATTATATATATLPLAAASAGPFAGPSAVDCLAQSMPPLQEMAQPVASACECTSTGWCPQHSKPRGRGPTNHKWQYVPSLGHWAYLHNETNALWDRIRSRKQDRHAPGRVRDRIAEAKRADLQRRRSVTYAHRQAARRKNVTPLRVDKNNKCNCPPRCYCDVCPTAKKDEAETVCPPPCAPASSRIC